MKFVFLTFILVLSQTLSAQTHTVFQIEIPYPSHQERYTGSIRSEESQLMDKLLSRAAKICGGKEHIGMIENVEAKFTFDVISKNSVNFQGSYPLSSVIATIHCQ